MDRDRIKDEYLSKWPMHWAVMGAEGGVIEFAEHIATIARNEALEEAAKIAFQRCGGSIGYAKNVADQIRALKIT